MDKLTVVLFALLVAVFISFLLSWPAYMLWNSCLVGAVDGVKEITWGQAWGISLLCGILFKESSVSSSK